jgi:LuxR family transcriptional regulator, quorum-sensing system regulator SdiA
MTDLVDRLADGLAAAPDVDACLDLMAERAAELGFSCVIYDFAPVPRSHTGAMLVPNVLLTRNAPESFAALWCDEGYCRIDPVQQACLDSSIPFVWSHLGEDRAIATRPLTSEHQPVVAYLKETRLTCGATVPIHLSSGGLATVTAISIDPEPDFARDARRQLGTLSMLAHHTAAAIFGRLDHRAKRCQAVRLSEREIECLRWAAQGKTAQDIADILGRSLGTICLHLNNATRKLHALNRAQAVAHAFHYRLFDSLH